MNIHETIIFIHIYIICLHINTYTNTYTNIYNIHTDILTNMPKLLHLHVCLGIYAHAYSTYKFMHVFIDTYLYVHT